MAELNPEQRQAIEHGQGPQLVIAGPGSGKTRVITERIVHLLRAEPTLPPSAILALTFTDKAAAEMKRRVSALLPELDSLPFVATFHAFCYHVLRERHFDRRLLDSIDVWIFLRRRMEELGLEHYRKLAEPGAFLHDLNQFFSRCQDELIEPDAFEAYAGKLEEDFAVQSPKMDAAERVLLETEVARKRELARVFRLSRGMLEENGCSSLGSLIPETVHLFDREPEFAARYRSLFRHVLVDEFQDTNFAQVELLRRLVPPPYNVTAVGDDDQAIYRFRGAAHGAFEMFGRVFPGHRTVYLNRNYRSTRRILRVADALIRHNSRYVSKPPLKATLGEGLPVYLLASPDDVAEAAWVAEEVKRLASRGTPHSAMAVLYRAHRHRDRLVEEFRRRGIPFSIRGLSLLSTVILRDLVAYLRLIHSPHDNVSLTRVLVETHWRFPEELAFDVRLRAAKERCSLYDALEARQRTLWQDELQATGWGELKKLLTDLHYAAARVPVTALFDRLVDRLELMFLPGSADQVAVDAFRKFLEAWEEKSETRRLGEFMGYFDFFVEAGGKIEAAQPDATARAVQMMTVHAAKGLEFPVVFVVSVAPRRFPHPEQKAVIEFPEELRRGPRPPADIHLQEERRLFYVGLTRAQERLYVSSLSKSQKRVSKFVDDLLSDAAVAARSVERLQAPETVPPKEEPPAAQALPRPAPKSGQAELFPAAADGGRVRPPLAAWATRPPAAPDGTIRLSATAIEDYLNCPLKFKFHHFLKIPTGPQAALTFGNILHGCVRRYFELRQKTSPRFEDLERYYLGAWKSTGFEDAYQEETYKKAGLEQLRKFVEQHNAQPAPPPPARLEEGFAMQLDDVVLEGRIDRIRALEPGGGSGPPLVELIDYKTGRPRTQKDADKSLQLSIYALAARRHFRLEPHRLTFYNLTSNQAISTVRTEQDLAEVRERVREVAGEIRRLLFPPRPGFICKYCDFVPICPAHEEEF